MLVISGEFPKLANILYAASKTENGKPRLSLGYNLRARLNKPQVPFGLIILDARKIIKKKRPANTILFP